MAGDRYKKVLPGEKLEISAEVWNALIDATREVKGKHHDQLADPLTQDRQADIIRVKNMTGEARERFHVLGIDVPIIDPADKLREFKNQVALEGVKPHCNEHYSRFVILLEPLKAEKIGRAWVSGVCAVQVDVEDECHEFADVKHCDPTCLVSRPVGSARILWRVGGTGKQWAVVRLSNTPQDVRRFQLTEPLARCGSAEAVRVIYDGSNDSTSCPDTPLDPVRWCETDCPFTVYDSLGIVCPEICTVAVSGCGLDAVAAGTYGWAKWMPDSRKWEVIALGEGCCGSSSSSSSSSSGEPCPSSFEEMKCETDPDCVRFYKRTVTIDFCRGCLEFGEWQLCCCAELCSYPCEGSSSSSCPMLPECIDVYFVGEQDPPTGIYKPGPPNGDAAIAWTLFSSPNNWHIYHTGGRWVFEDYLAQILYESTPTPADCPESPTALEWSPVLGGEPVPVFTEVECPSNSSSSSG